ncbi:DUF563 domain-containing protein [Candidatus Planktophila lacus]|uniref:glycosyltransferase family 61 protein n=1 Tax=Candidatus Planktophila lacus TaxID=1884913 RepID=UPI000BAC6769|nr:glycosyltransferase family 61 protein [Candidatus Planktophila lacus]ASY28461.1 DUF563 domain-containing protein [Candidatus Planktophila lacus]
MINFKNKSHQSVKVFGIIDTSLIEDINSVIFMAGNDPIQCTFQDINISKWLKILTGGESFHSLSMLRKSLLYISRNLHFIRLTNKKRFTLNIPESFFLRNEIKTISCWINSVELDVFVTRNLAQYGIKTKFLDLNLDYALAKNWPDMQVIIGYSKHCSEIFPKFGQVNCEFTEARLVSEVMRTLKPGELAHKCIQDARIVHGQAVVDEKFFYPVDTLKIPEILNSQSLPAPYWRDSYDRAVFPKCIRSKPKIDEAIFLGGTNNLMHFAIEEIPKLYKLSLMNLSEEIPLILRNDLSIQIREMFEALSSRKLIFIDNYEDISVGRLHIIQFNNPLRKSMSGDQDADEVLFNSTAMEWARVKCQELVPTSWGITRIQITRERGLFRQLTNVDKLSLSLKQEFNFQPIFTGNSNLQKAVAQFRDANIVIGEYGAGLANILFCHPGSIVIEIRGPAERNAREYYLLCRSLNIKHFLIVGHKRNLSKYGLGNGQFEIEVEDLMKIVRPLLVDGAS